MSVAAAPKLTGKSLLGKLALSLDARAKGKKTTSRAAAAIRDHGWTITALGLICTGLWHVSDVAGWVGVGVSVLVAELKIRG